MQNPDAVPVPENNGQQDAPSTQVEHAKHEPLRDSLSGLTFEEEMAWRDFTHGPGYDPDPLRRLIRFQGGHCSGAEALVDCD